MTGQQISWQNPRVLTVLLLVFLCGAAAGALTMRLGSSVAARRPATYWHEGGKQISIERFRRELKLTPEQSRRMEEVLNDFLMYYQTLEAQMNEVRATGKSRILSLLDENQKQKFLQMISDQKKQQGR